MLTFALVPTSQPKNVKIHLKHGTIIECQLRGVGVENAINNLLIKKNTPLVLKLVGAARITYLSTEDVSHIETSL